MQKIEPAKIPPLGFIESREGARDQIRSIHRYFETQLQNETNYRRIVQTELDYLYGETDYAPGSLANGAQATVSISVPGAIPGYCVEAAYDRSLQGLQVTYYVDAADTVIALLRNGTGGGITLAAGRFRAYVKPRTLST